MNIQKFKQNKLVKNKYRSTDTTITIKVSRDLRNKWNLFCINNDINQRKTLENFIEEVIKDD